MKKFYWSQKGYNNYVLLGPQGSAQTFKSWEALRAHCVKNKIDATQS